MRSPRTTPTETRRRSPARLLAAALLATATVALPTGARGQAALSVVAPQGLLSAPGNEALPGPGLGTPARLQVLIDEVHLGPVRGRTITGFRLRRQNHPRAFLPGGALWTVRISVAPHVAADVQPAFDSNLGPAVLVPAALPVAAPASPAPTGTLVGWTNADSLQFVLPAPFAYPGGTLCLDISGRADPNAPPTDWPIDAVSLPRLGASVVPLGPSCGVYGPGEWSFVDETTLLPGATAKFTAFGTPSGLGVFVIGTTQTAAPLPLDVLGSAPGCFAYLADTALTQLAFFSPPVAPVPTAGGMAVVALRIPAEPVFLGVSLLDQWLDLSQVPFAVSGGHLWTVAAQPQSLGISTVFGSPQPGALEGEVLPDFGPVVQILF